LLPSRVDACNPLLQAHTTWARDKHEGRGISTSHARLPPFALRLAPTHLGWGMRRQFTRRSRDPPVSKHRQPSIRKGELYKHGVCSLLLKCLSKNEGHELMKEIHAGLCGAHIRARPLLGKVFRQGFYWPKAASDVADLVQKCENCQKCARDKKQPSSLTQLIQPTWPLQRCGLDLL
jgi:hypothetical protein